MEEVSDALVEQFELVESAHADDIGDGRVAVRVSGSAMGRVDRFDHPVASLVGIGVAEAVRQPVTVDVTTAADEGDVSVVTCSWAGEETDGS